MARASNRNGEDNTMPKPQLRRSARQKNRRSLTPTALEKKLPSSAEPPGRREIKNLQPPPESGKKLLHQQQTKLDIHLQEHIHIQKHQQQQQQQQQQQHQQPQEHNYHVNSPPPLNTTVEPAAISPHRPELAKLRREYLRSFNRRNRTDPTVYPRSAPRPAEPFDPGILRNPPEELQKFASLGPGSLEDIRGVSVCVCQCLAIMRYVLSVFHLIVYWPACYLILLYHFSR